ncbi:MAG: hypothetical protein J1F06_03965 [Prevotellaceae bacterium]|nr:hypothetical protein [Prevotellaceae bacterium]
MSETRVERLAVCRLHLADGRVLRNQVVELSCGRLRCHYPLVGEIAFCRWYGGDCYVGADASISFATFPE